MGQSGDHHPAAWYERVLLVLLAVALACLFAAGVTCAFRLFAG